MSAYASVTATILAVGAWVKDLIANTASVPVTGSIGATIRTQVVHVALATNHVLKASAGTLYSATVYIDPTIGAGAFYVLPLNQVSAVNGVRNLLLAPIPCVAGDYVTVPCGNGVAADTGITLALSSTVNTSSDGPPPTATLTLTGAYLRLTSAEVGA